MEKPVRRLLGGKARRTATSGGDAGGESAPRVSPGGAALYRRDGRRLAMDRGQRQARRLIRNSRMGNVFFVPMRQVGNVFSGEAVAPSSAPEGRRSGMKNAFQIARSRPAASADRFSNRPSRPAASADRFSNRPNGPLPPRTDFRIARTGPLPPQTD